MIIAGQIWKPVDKRFDDRRILILRADHYNRVLIQTVEWKMVVFGVDAKPLYLKADFMVNGVATLCFITTKHNGYNKNAFETST